MQLLYVSELVSLIFVILLRGGSILLLFEVEDDVSVIVDLVLETISVIYNIEARESGPPVAASPISS